jgi:hypothetical protein
MKESCDLLSEFQAFILLAEINIYNYFLLFRIICFYENYNIR